ncbi:WD40-repeat-containing domain protein [Roridomyces roridus]|uniref:WD40-repeat-containing domain protein n=1 Tax=Roridomyces roridus TaxID=1738132 RepID=A0AAD7B0K3_9AGAR|nr:WD40-repeat-containing domain protein [Roridomyces roridus]
MEDVASYTWVPPEYDLSRPPSQSASWKVPSPTLPGNFARSAKWCPDGSAALAQCEHREFRLLNPLGEDETTFNPHTFAQPAPILDYAWYPTASVTSPATFCFVASVRETPVKLLDASDGRLRASYRIVDHRERQIAPHSLAFNLSATRLYCGFEDAIEVFDVAQPGEGTRLHTTPSKKNRDGLKGIISALAFSPSYESDLYSAGSLSPTEGGNIAVFSETGGAVPVSFVSGGPAAGVTQLHFNPAQPHILYAAFRRRSEIFSWDLRDTTAPLKIYTPPSANDRETNQKRRFDVDLAGRFLALGDQEGRVSVFDLAAEENTPRLTYTAHSDALGSVSFHPTKPTLLSVSGSRHFHTDEDEESSSEDGEDEEDDQGQSGKAAVIRRSVARPTPVPLDASIRVWDFGPAGSGVVE